MRIALVDIDGMIFAAGCVVEDVYHVVDNLRFNFKSEANEYCDTHGLSKKDIEKEVDAQPVSHALSILKTMIEAACNEADCGAYESYLSPTDKSNFRFEIDPEYKANRKNAHKPVHFQALRDYAVQHLGTKVVTGMEADDMLNIRALELGYEEVVIISADKDMLQLPTYHYNWSKKTPVHKVEEYEGWQSFYMQLLTGDSVDNIKGCPGIGPAKAAKALKDCATDKDMLESCYQCYLKAYDSDDEEAAKQMRLNAKLLRLLEVRP